MYHPVVASIPCTACTQWLVNIDTGKFDEWPRGSGRRIPRTNVPTPCWKCPKESPAKEREHVLSDKNQAAFRLAREVRGTFGRCLTGGWEDDPILRRNLGIIQALLEEYDEYVRTTEVMSLAGATVAGVTRKIGAGPKK